MKKLLLETSFSKIYMIVMILITLLILGGYFSYAMFTVSKEKSNAISIVTGNLTYKLAVDGKEDNKLVVPANTTKEFIVTLSNPNNRIARFNFYYMGTLEEGVDTGYIEETDYNTPPSETGINLEASGTSGSINTYLIRVSNITDNEITVTLGASVGLDYNDLTLPSNGHLFEEYEGVDAADTLIADPNNKSDNTDPEQIFITGENPNNYFWYSGKLWRAISIDPSDNSIKLMTEWTIGTISYDDTSTAFSSSHIKAWLNDESVDGFLGNLREPEKFIKMDSVWNATMTTSTSKPAKTTMITAPVGLINIYEYVMTYKGASSSTGYLNNGLVWWILNPADVSNNYYIYTTGTIYTIASNIPTGIRPVINLKPGIKIVDGTGTETDPYRLEGDNDTNISGTKLNTRYSGEYISFGTGENNLYRIVSHENSGLTKITSAEPLKNNDSFVLSAFGTNSIYSSTNTIGSFLNNDYLNPSNGYLTTEQVNMIENSTTWYLGTVTLGQNYLLAKYTNTSMTSPATSTTAKVGLLRYGELMTGQFARFRIKSEDSYTNLVVRYYLLTPPGNNTQVWTVHQASIISAVNVPSAYGVKPVMNLKSSVTITGGEGTKEDPFTLKLN